MKAIVLSLIIVLSPTVALSLDNQTQEILEKRTCQYLKSGLTLGETTVAIRYAVNQNGRPRSEFEGVNILIDEFNRLMTEKILENAKKRCPQLFPRN